MGNKERKAAIETGMVFRQGRLVPRDEYTRPGYLPRRPMVKEFLCAYCFKPGGQLVNFGPPDAASGVQIKGHPECEPKWNELGAIGQHTHIQEELIRRGLLPAPAPTITLTVGNDKI